MIPFSFAVICGTALAFWGNSQVDLFWISLLPIFLLLAWLQPGQRMLWICISALLWSSLLFHQLLDHRLSEEFENREVLVQGTVSDITDKRRNSIRFYLEPDFIESYYQPLPNRIRLNWYRNEQRPQAGQRWQLAVKMRRPSGFQNPGTFNYQQWLFVKGIDATGYVRKSDSNRQLSESGRFNIDRFRQLIIDAQSRACRGCEYHGLFKALTTGYRGDIQPQHAALLRDTGTAHLLAISGLHIGLVAGQFYLLGGFLWRRLLYRSRFNRLEVSALIAFVAAFAYSALAGFSIPTVRALVMLAVVFAALTFRRNINLLNSICIAISLILLLDPRAIGDTSLWLSFSALLVIAFGQFLITSTSSRVRQALMIQLLFSLLFIPLSMLLFNQVTPSGFLANIIAIPVLGILILPLTLITSLLAVLDLSAAQWLFYLLDSLTGWLLDYLQFLQSTLLPATSFSDRPVLFLASLAIATMILLLPVDWRTRIPAVVLLLIILSWRVEGIPDKDFRVTVLDVGMGTAVSVETQHHSLVYDFGPGNRDGFSAGDWVVKPYLRYRGIEQLDLMIVSHVDSDHSGGFISFKEDLGAVPLVSGTPQALAGRFELETAVRSCHQYPAWLWDGVEFEFLSSAVNAISDSTNNQSCVLRISGNHRVLLTGDIEADQEYRLLKTYASKLSAEVLLAPHHGSLTSSTEAFVNAVDAEIVIFTLGKNNRWSFPKPEVISRYRRTGAELYRSDRDGAVTIMSEAGALTASRWRHQNRIWH